MDEHPDYITVTSGLRGYFAVHMAWDKEFKGYEPWQTGVGSYKERAGAEKEGKSWASSEGLEFKS